MAGRDADVVVVGGGVIGLSAAAALACAGRSVVLIERRDALARETTARTSEVIHVCIVAAMFAHKHADLM